MLLLCALITGSGTAWATDFTLSSANNVTQDGITVSFAKGSGSNAPAWYSAGLRLYASNTITIESSGNKIESITFNWEKQSNKTFNTATASVGSYTHPSAAGEGTWTGSAQSVTFTLGGTGQLQLNTFSVTLEGGGGQTTTYSVTYDANGGEGDVPEDDKEYDDTDNTVTVLDNDNDNLTMTGHTFSGWNTEPNGTGDPYEAGDEFTIDADITLYAQWTPINYAVTFSNPSNGTLVVKNGETTITSGATVPYGTTLTIEATPSLGYNLTKWEYNAAGAGWNDGEGTSYTVESAVEFRASFEEKIYHTITYIVNGVSTTDEVEEGEAISFTDPDASEIPTGCAFMGWVAEANKIDTPTNTAPANYVTSATCTKDETYYAVLAVQTGSASTVHLTSDEIASNFAGTAMAYSDSERSYTDTSDDMTWAAKCVTNQNRHFIQLKNDVNAYIKMVAPAEIKEVKVRITNASNQSGGIDDPTKHGNFAGDVLLDNVQATNTGTYGSASYTALNEGILTITPTKSSETLYIHVNSGARIWNIDVTYSSISYSNYVTAPIAVANVSSAEYATYITPMDVDFTLTDGLTAYKAVSTGNGKVNLTKVEKAPAETPLVLNGSEGTYALQAATGTLDDVSDNLLAVSGNGNVVGNGNIYVLANIDGVGFYQLASNATLPKGKVYLDANANSVKFLNFSFDTNEADGIEAIEKAGVGEGSVYDLQGRRLSVQGALPKGVYIVNGKKVMVK